MIICYFAMSLESCPPQLSDVKQQTWDNLTYFQSQQHILRKRLATTELQLDENESLFEKLEALYDSSTDPVAREQTTANMISLAVRENRLLCIVAYLKKEIAEFGVCATLARSILFD